MLSNYIEGLLFAIYEPFTNLVMGKRYFFYLFVFATWKFCYFLLLLLGVPWGAHSSPTEYSHTYQ